MKIVIDLQGAQSGSSRFRGIGRYSVSFTQALAREASRHEIWLALSGRFPETIEPLCSMFADLIPPSQIKVMELPGPVAEADLENSWRMKAAELVREKFLADLRPDIVLVSSMCEGAGNEVVVSAGRFNSDIATSVLIYDLIPLLHPEIYLTFPPLNRSYYRHVQSLKRADLLLAISESTRREAIDLLGVAPERIVTIGAGLAESFRKEVRITPDARTELLARYALDRPFILNAGAVDPHKNVEGLIAAFALLPLDLRASHRIVHAGKLPEEDRNRLLSLARKHGVGDSLCFLGYVPDADLRTLYALSSVFVLPSLHEGFGLPVLEAMACGAPVLASNRGSIPEIVNREDALFDPLQPAEIAGRIAKVLIDAEFRENLRNWGPQRASAFTWEASAQKALRALEALHERQKLIATTVVTRGSTRLKQRLAFVSPLPPSQAPIADYAARLVRDLSRYYEIACIVEDYGTADPWISANFEIQDKEWFASNATRFGRILYHVGSRPEHKYVLNLSEEYPGIVDLHDFHLGELFHRMEETSVESRTFVKAVYESHGFSALQKDNQLGRKQSMETYPCNAAVLRGSIGIVVHSQETFRQMRHWYGEDLPISVRHIPYPDPPGQPGRINLYQERLAPYQTTSHENVARLYHDFIDETYRTSFNASEQSLLHAIARTEAPSKPGTFDLAAIADAIAANRLPFGPRQILIDVSILAQVDSRTGIQRVVRAILMALINDPPAGYRIEPVRASNGGYLYARRFASRFLSLPEDILNDDPVETATGDIFLGLDLCYDQIPEMIPWFEHQRARGVAIKFVIYDILSQKHPEWFYPQIAPAVRKWLETLERISDGLICISRTVADEVAAWLSDRSVQRKTPLSIGFFPLGADLHASLPSTGLPDNVGPVLDSIKVHPTFLMVGTIEPRKGHRQAIAAMEKLWQSGTEANLVIVGKTGWLMQDFEEKMSAHSELGRRLFWLQGISDEMLEQIYRSAAALLAPSEGEGFGLPLIEAAQFGLPIIARDLSVFREVAGEHAYYFRGDDAQALANALRGWLSLGDGVPTSTGIARLTWLQSSRQLLDVVLRERCYRVWPPVTKISLTATIAGNPESLTARDESNDEVACE